MSDASRARGRKATKKSAAAGSEEQLAQNAQEQQQAPRGRDAPRVDDQHVQPEMVAAITQEVMRQLEARPQRDRSRERSKSKKGQKRRRRDRSPSRSSSDSDSDSSGTSTCSSDNSDSDESDSDGDQTPKLISSPIASQVESKLKNKIWQDKYVDFAKLLPFREENDDNDGFQIQSAGKSDFKILKTKKKGQIRNIEQWTNAFLRFVAIYSIKHPKKVPNVLKHGEIVRDLASRKTGSAWLVYDQQVRRDMEVRSIPWGKLHYEYWVMATTAKPYGGGNQSNQPFRGSKRESTGPRGNKGGKQGARVPAGFCYGFHRTGKCTNQSCSYKHFCFQCRNQHSVLFCTGSESSGQGQSTNAGTGSKSVPQSTQSSGK